ncbi:hypothetical protein PX699_13280 [Sphingobium sp. H39-3-25]|uniref:hypothetical protein n=1 Tax=Sphingobium arseniciresistens TaxID=3030834 RepID=UPI0023B99574|nr:hypothetical protein [Sphingobium arseniciresistens]
MTDETTTTISGSHKVDGTLIVAEQPLTEDRAAAMERQLAAYRSAQIAQKQAEEEAKRAPVQALVNSDAYAEVLDGLKALQVPSDDRIFAHVNAAITVLVNLKGAA